MAETFPSDWRDQPCFLVAVPAPLVPYASGLLKILEQRGFWEPGSYVDAYQAVIELEECFMSACLNTLFEKQDAMYRLLNTALFGQLYETTSTDPLVVTPAIEPHVTLDVLDQDSIMGRIDRLVQLVDNAINGTSTPLYTYSPSVKALLQSIIDALATDETDLSDILAQLEIVAGLLA
jgi:hypothetical protein